MSGATFTRNNPVTGEPASTAPAATVADANAACDAAAAAFPVWSTLGPNARRAALTSKAGIDSFTELRRITVQTLAGHFPI